jgi:hypothetical protein
VLHYTRLESYASEKHSSLLDLSLSYEENEVFEYSIMYLLQNAPKPHPGLNGIKKLRPHFTNIPNNLECMTLKSLSSLV